MNEIEKKILESYRTLNNGQLSEEDIKTLKESRESHVDSYYENQKGRSYTD